MRERRFEKMPISLAHRAGDGPSDVVFAGRRRAQTRPRCFRFTLGAFGIHLDAISKIGSSCADTTSLETCAAVECSELVSVFMSQRVP